MMKKALLVFVVLIIILFSNLGNLSIVQAAYIGQFDKHPDGTVSPISLHGHVGDTFAVAQSLSNKGTLWEIRDYPERNYITTIMTIPTATGYRQEVDTTGWEKKPYTISVTADDPEGDPVVVWLYLADILLKIYLYLNGRLVDSDGPFYLDRGDMIRSLTGFTATEPFPSTAIFRVVKSIFLPSDLPFTVVGRLKLLRKNEVIEVRRVKYMSVTDYEFEITEAGLWTFEHEGTVQGGVGGFVVPVDKFGLLAPYIGLASTIIAATVATAIYVKRVKHRKEKQ